VSRIDDADRQARRAAEQLAIRRKKEEARGKERQQAEGPFAKVLRKFHAGDEAGAPQSKAEVDPAVAADAPLGESELLGQMATSKFGEGGALKSGKFSSDRQGVARPRGSDARTQEGKEPHAARPGGSDALEHGPSSPGMGLRGDGDLRGDAEGGDGNGSGSGADERERPTAQPTPGLRFNPALLAPVPVAMKKETGRSEPLRALAAEIAERIVDRVRVGTNAAGMAEFQIELRSDVLTGLSIRISAGAGIIRASFSGTDREVLKLLRNNAEALKHALAGRGLTLGELRIEERA
jgi:hypothetical protein